MDFLDNNVFVFNRKKLRKIYIWTMVIVALVILLVMMCHVIKVKTFYKNKMVINNVDDNYFVSANVFLDDVNTILNNYELYIGNDKYNYLVKQLGELEVENNKNIVKVVIDVDLPDKYQINNLVLNFRIKSQVQSTISYIKNLI